MAIDLKQGIDLKQLGPQIKALFGKDSNFFANKLVVFSIISILLSIFLVFLIFGMTDNQSLFDQAKNSNDKASRELSKLEKEFRKTIDSNKVYFDQLKNSPKTQSELSANITALVSQYSLQLNSIDLNTKIGKSKDANGVQLVVSGSYLNLIRFSSEMNKALAASKLVNLAVKKSKKSNILVMSLSILYAAPPASNTLPLPKKTEGTKNTVRLFGQENFFYSLLDIFISPVNAVEVETLPPLEKETETNGLSLFQKAYAEATAKGLSQFEFTNKAGKTQVYATGIKPSADVELANQELQVFEKLPEILPTAEVETLPPLEKETETNGLSLFQKAYAEATAKGLSQFEFTNKAGKTQVYATGIKPSADVELANQELQVFEKLPEILPTAEVETLPPLEIPTTAKIESKQDEKVDIRLREAKPLNDFQRAYVNALIEGQKMFEYTDPKGKTSVYKTNEEGFKAAGFVENPAEIIDQEAQESLDATTESLRDPFAAPGTANRAFKANKNKGSVDTSEDQYYLSGVLTSESTELCVVITPIGESKIYHVGEKINNDTTITGIYANAIMINGSTKKILIGDEIQ